MKAKNYDMEYVNKVFTTEQADSDLRTKCHKEDYFSFGFNEDSKVLDFGLGLGLNTIWCKNKYGYDINKGLYPQLKEKGFTMFDSIEDITENFFDEILISQVLEHVDYPMETLKMLHSKLKVGGKIRVVVPNIRYKVPTNLNSEYISGHLHVWSHMELNYLLNRSGFTNIHNKIIYRRGEVAFMFLNNISFRLYRFITKLVGRLTKDLDVFVVGIKNDILNSNRAKLIKWKGNPNIEEKHKHDYRLIKDKKEKEEWIKKHWEVEE